MRKLPAFVNIFIMSTLNASAQPAYTFTRYLERNGIPTTTIEKIIQDDDGYLWLASWSGLYRFDGINFVNYRTGQGDARTGGADDRLADLHHDAYGHIWLLSYSNTLYRFDCSDGEMDEPVNARIMSVFKLSDTDFRFVTAGGEILRSEYSRNGQSCSLVRYLDIPDGESVVRICKDSEGTVWTLTEHAIYKDTGKLTDSPGYCFFEGRDGLYFGSSAGKLLKYDGSALDTIDTGISGRVELLAEIPGRHEFLTGSAGNLVCWDAGDGSVSAVKCDSWTNGRLQLQTDDFGNIWIYSDRGSLNWYDKDKMELLPFYNGSLQREWNAETYVNTVFADSQSNLWIAGSWGGLERASYNAGEFRLMRPDPRPEAPADANNVRAVFQGSTGLIYAATRDGKVHILGDGMKERAVWQTPAPVYAIAESDGAIWLGTKGAGIMENAARTPGTTAFYPLRYCKDERYYAPNSDMIYDLNTEDPERLWIASFDGSLSYIDMSDSRRQFISKKNLLTFPTEQLNMMRHVRFGPDGRLYACGTLGLFVCDNPGGRPEEMEFTRFPSVKDYDIQHILFTDDGELWASSSGNGFLHFSGTGSDSSVSHYTSRNGIMSNFVLSAVQDRSGNIWIASNGGLNKFNPESGSIIGYSYSRLGLDMRFNEGEPLLTSDGEICFNTTRGIMHFDPEKVSNSSFVPKILISYIMVTGRRKAPDAAGKVRMKRRDALTLRFLAIDLSAPERVLYSYRLEGRDDRWTSLGRDPRIQIDGLKPGRYTLWLRSTNADGVPVRNETPVSIVVSPGLFLYLSVPVLLAAALLGMMLSGRRGKRKRTPDEAEAAESEDQKFRRELTAYLESHIDDGELNIAAMAAAMNMSRSALFEKCRSVIGIAPLEYLRNMRFAKAAEMLSSGDYSISQIAYATGFNDSHYFSKAFKQKFGMTPSEYRKAGGGRDTSSQA